MKEHEVGRIWECMKSRKERKHNEGARSRGDMGVYEE